MQQHALGRVYTQPGEEFGVAQRQLDHFAQLLDRFGDAADVVVIHHRAAGSGLFEIGAQLDLGILVDMNDALGRGADDAQANLGQRIGRRVEHPRNLGRHVLDRLLAGRGAKVRLASRSAQRAADAANKVNEFLGSDLTIPYATADLSQLRAALDDIDLVIAAGAAGIELLPAAELHDATGVKVAIDLNAVPPSGIENVKATDQAVQLGTTTVYGAVGVGITKMKIHKAAIASLFERHDLVLDAEEIFEIACRL